jgi:hypothetical protein
MRRRPFPATTAVCPTLGLTAALLVHASLVHASPGVPSPGQSVLGPDPIGAHVLPSSDTAPSAPPFRAPVSTPFVAPRVAEGQFEPTVRYCRNPVTGGVLPRPVRGTAWSDVDTEACLPPTPMMSIRERVMRGW